MIEIITEGGYEPEALYRTQLIVEIGGDIIDAGRIVAQERIRVGIAAIVSLGIPLDPDVVGPITAGADIGADADDQLASQPVELLLVLRHQQKAMKGAAVDLSVGQERVVLTVADIIGRILSYAVVAISQGDLCFCVAVPAIV